MCRINFIIISIFIALLYLASCDSGGENSTTSPQPTPMPTSNPGLENQFGLINTFPNINFENPIDIQNTSDGTNRLFVAEQKGVITVLSNLPNTQNNEITARNATSNIFLDIRSQVLNSGEQGLLGLAFHPDFANNSYFYVNYSANNPRRSVISRFNVSTTNPNLADKQSELILFEILQPNTNHNGGQLVFGPQDGYLYISMGDGGSGGAESQDLTNLLGSIIRIDVDNPQGQLNYGIPPNNPFANNPSGLREEIYAYGLRNPWRIAFDVVSGRLWSGDVGQNSREEINIINNGGNHGWPIVEGTQCFTPPAGCNPSDFELPVLEYGRNQGGSVIGGVLYYGDEFPELFGMYIYADFISGRVWALDYDGANVVDNVELLQFNPFSIVAFGLDEQGELYIASFDGNIYQLQRIDNL